MCRMKLLIFFAFFPHIFASLDTTWWKHTILYQVYPWSFKDSNGDGIGDFNGITEKLDHFVDLNIDTIYINPFFKSPMVDIGYDISNYTDVDPIFGTMQDFDRLMTEMRKRGLKLIADLVINHSSDEHPWFQKSVNRMYPYTDYYVWADPKGYDTVGKPMPPNNWMCKFRGSAWQWNDKRKQFYYHLFAPKQPDLNLRNENVKKEIKNIIKFWLEKGVAGFRLDAPQSYLEDELLRDEPLLDPNQKEITKHGDLKNIYTFDLWESHSITHEMRQYVEEYNKKDGVKYERIFIAEVYTDLDKTMIYYGSDEYKITHFPLNFHFAMMDQVIPAKLYDNGIRSWLENMPKEATPNWMAENHDTGRINYKLGEEYMDIITTTILTLPGVAGIYYGQEIGMQKFKVRPDQLQDRYGAGGNRDGGRLPMQWDSSLNSGFSSSSKIWLPVHPNYWAINVETEKATKYSRYNMFKMLSQLRRSETLKYGEFHSYVISKWVYSYVRSCRNCKPYIVIINLGTETEMFDLHDTIPNLSSNMKIVIASPNAGYKSGDNIRRIPKFPRTFVMRPCSVLVLTNARG